MNLNLKIFINRCINLVIIERKGVNEEKFLIKVENP